MERSALKLLMVLALGAAACGGGTAGGGKQSETTTPAGQASSAEAPVSEAARQEAATIFATRCTPCHGQQGKGDGPASAGLVPKPRDLTDASWQQSVDDEYIERILRYGGSAVGKAPTMPPNPDLNSKPEVVQALRLHVRNLQGE